MKKFINDLRTVWAFWKWHRRHKPELSRGKVMGDQVCITDTRYLHPAYTPSELSIEVMRLAAQSLLHALLLRPYKVDVIVTQSPGHNNQLVRLLATPLPHGQDHAINQP